MRFPSRAAKSGYAYKSFPTRKEASAFLESGETAKSARLQRSSIRTIPQAIDLWLQACEKEGREERDPVSPSTLQNYRWRARTMKAFEWDVSLHDLREADVKAFRSWLKANCPPDKARKVLASFHSVLIEMKDRSIIADDPAEKVVLKSDSRLKEPVAIPSIEEFQAILAAADRLANSRNNEIAAAWERYRPMIYLAADSGMRPQEYLALPETALGECGVNVLQALDRSNRIGPPKTKAGRRYIPISPDVLGMVRSFAKDNAANGLVFPTRRGGACQLYRVFLRRGFHKLMEEAGFVTERRESGRNIREYAYTPYSLRHFYASMLIDTNKGLKQVQERMGHEDVTMTLNVYGHLIRKKDAERDDDGGILSFIGAKSCGGYVANGI